MPRRRRRRRRPNRIHDPIRSGLILELKMDEGVGATVHDTSGNRNHCSMPDAPTWSTYGGQTCLDFNGSGNRLLPETAPSFTDSDPWTITAWLVDEGTGTYNWWCGKNSTEEGITTSVNSNIRCVFEDKNGVQYIMADDSAYSPYLNKLTHHVYMADGSGGITLYLDGVLILTRTGISTQITIDYIGDGYSNHIYTFDGKIAGFRLYNRVLSLGEIRMLAGV